MIKFSDANAKTSRLAENRELKRWLRTGRKVYSLDLLSGFSCPFARDCLAKAVVDKHGKRKLIDGVDAKFRCFSASQEARLGDVYDRRKANFDALRAAASTDAMAQLILASLPADAGIVRIHVAGDFFTQAYFDAWIQVSKARPDVLFYAYTKSILYWVRRWDEVEQSPNFVLTASRGGRQDHLIDAFGIREARVVYSRAEARRLGLPIDHDDSHAAKPGKHRRRQSFALLIHGVQPAGTEASKALRKLAGEGSYRR